MSTGDSLERVTLVLAKVLEEMRSHFGAEPPVPHETPAAGLMRR